MLLTHVLCYIYDKNVDNIITPFHLVFGRRLLTQIQGNKNDQPTVENIKKRVQHIKNLLKHFWKRFQNEYLTELRERSKNINRSAKCEIKDGELVLISDKNLKRHRWRAAVVEELISSKDGYIRWCKLRITPPRWNPPWRGEGAYFTKRFSPSASTSRARRSDAATFDMD